MKYKYFSKLYHYSRTNCIYLFIFYYHLKNTNLAFLPVILDYQFEFLPEIQYINPVMQSARNFKKSDSAKVKQVTWVGLFGNVFLAGIKFILGIFGNSQAVLADAVHSLSDMSTDISVLIGVRFWDAPADQDHPYGHRRIETLVTVAIGLFLIWAAVNMGYEAIRSIGNKVVKHPSWIAIIGPIISIFLKEGLYRWTRNVGKNVKSQALIANAWHHRSDALGSIPATVAVAIAVFKPEWWFVDQIGALIVSMFILKVSWDIIIPALSELSEKGASKKEQDVIHQLAMSVSGVMAAHAIRSRKLGPGLYIDLHVLVDDDLTVKEGHDIATQVKSTLLNEGPDIADVVVHIEPFGEELSQEFMEY